MPPPASGHVCAHGPLCLNSYRKSVLGRMTPWQLTGGRRPSRYRTDLVAIRDIADRDEVSAVSRRSPPACELPGRHSAEDGFAIRIQAQRTVRTHMTRCRWGHRRRLNPRRVYERTLQLQPMPLTG